MKTDTRNQQVLNQQLALGAYLEALMGGPAVPSPEPPPFEVTPQPVPVPLAADPEPGWNEQHFQALLFEVAGVTLAVPLVQLKGVVPNDQGLTPMPGHSPLFLGLAPYQGLQSKVVDTARFILPPDRLAQLGDTSESRCRHLVVIDEGRWALACSQIGDVIELARTDVKWRGAGGKRIWLAGTVIERMCALLDVERLCEELASGLPLEG